MKKAVIRSCAFIALTLSAVASPLEVDSQQSQIQVAVTSNVDSFVAHLEKFDARLDCDPQSALPRQANLDFNFANLKTGKPARDSAMLKWLDYSDYRTGSFHLTGWKQEHNATIALGDLTIHGVKQPVQLPVSVLRNGSAWDITGSTLLDYRDFNLPRIRKALLLTVNPRLKISFHLVGRLPASK